MYRRKEERKTDIFVVYVKQSWQLNEDRFSRGLILIVAYTYAYILEKDEND